MKSPANFQDFPPVILRYIDGHPLSEAEEEELIAWLKEHPEHVREFARLLHFESLMLETVPVLLTSPQTVRQKRSITLPNSRTNRFVPVQPTRKNSFLFPLSIAASLFIAFIWFLASRHTTTPPSSEDFAAVVMSIRGQISWNNPEKTGMKGTITPGQKLGNFVAIAGKGSDSKLLLNLPGTGQLQLLGQFTAKLRRRIDAGKKDSYLLTIESGIAALDIIPSTSRPAFEIKTPHAGLQVVGTRFVVHISSDYTRLSVLDGIVRFEPRDGSPVYVTKGETAEAKIKRKPWIAGTDPDIEDKMIEEVLPETTIVHPPVPKSPAIQLPPEELLNEVALADFSIYNATTDKPIPEYDHIRGDHIRISLKKLPPYGINIAANPAYGRINRVVLRLIDEKTGKIVESTTEKFWPYFLFGDPREELGNANPGWLEPGRYILEAVPYSKNSKQDQGPVLRLHLEVVP
ncbi:MAG: hypothetical protein D6820_13590 [Lentisphaerae bacterium]|nr:MAG: hypothetical protein D6820_13590 [Lentisphaerota bacterium]